MLRGMRCLSNGPIVRFRYCGISVDARASLLEMARVWQHLADEQGRATNVQQQQAAIAVKGDVAKAADMQRLFDETKKAFGTIDVLVNDAGCHASRDRGHQPRLLARGARYQHHRTVSPFAALMRSARLGRPRPRKRDRLGRP
jgi:NAD(P)-dependent dehydrogenase (short-subunit alcohol dehydrogenase family)